MDTGMGEIKNIESHKKHLRGRVRIEYDYDVIWEMDGQTFEKHFEGDWGRTPVPGPVDIWVSPDNTNIHFSSAEEIKKEVPIEIAIGVIAGFIGYDIYKEYQELMTRSSSSTGMMLAAVFGMLSCIGIFGYATRKMK